MPPTRSPGGSTYRTRPHPAVAVAVTAGGGVCWLATLALSLGVDPAVVGALVPLCLGIVVLPAVMSLAAR